MLIDPPTWPAHGTLWSHVVSDASYDELHDFATHLGIPSRLFDFDHYDLPQERYAEAVAAGAIEVAGGILIRRLIASGLRVRERDRH